MTSDDRRGRAWMALAATVLLLGACSGGGRPPTAKGHRSPGHERTATPSLPPSTPHDIVSPPPVEEGRLLLSSGLERPVCGNYHHPPPGCEFGKQFDVEEGPFGCRTGEGCVRLGRFASKPEQHVHLVRAVSLPDGHAFEGAAHRVPAIEAGTFPSTGYIQLMQLSAATKDQGTVPVEVRLYEDRRLGLSQLDKQKVEMSDYRTPVDQWFYVVVELSHGVEAAQRMWVFDPHDRLVDGVELTLNTTTGPNESPRQALGGTIPTRRPFDTYVDDWYIATTFMGPLHIGADGTPLTSTG